MCGCLEDIKKSRFFVCPPATNLTPSVSRSLHLTPLANLFLVYDDTNLFSRKNITNKVQFDVVVHDLIAHLQNGMVHKTCSMSRVVWVNQI